MFRGQGCWFDLQNQYQKQKQKNVNHVLAWSLCQSKFTQLL